MFDHKNENAAVTYFTCTLGEAAFLKTEKSPSFETVNDLIDSQARSHPNAFAVGFPYSGDKEWGASIFTFQNLQNGSQVTDAQLQVLKERSDNSKTIALLCPSSIEFLFSWLRLMRAGYSVLIIAPQCSPDAVSHLCKSCDAKLLLYHEMYSDLALSSKNHENKINIMQLSWTPPQNTTSSEWIDRYQPQTSQPVKPSKDDVAYIFHTSGTSGGFPKPVPQTHHAAVGVLPSLSGLHPATFTTTPLYHGGIADCFRAWSSGAMIWLFPGADLPITSKNILQCLSTAEAYSKTHGTSSVRYFSSVPYILEMLYEEQESLSMLRTMDLVGVGGAALALKIGDKLVQAGVNLLSRFGSAECGFLLSSHRDYKVDTDWQFLRVPPHSPHLTFEPQPDESGLFELVIRRGWPHMSKTNREDGSFATSDLFEPHDIIDGAWRYHGRSDSQITLVTGKKFDPEKLEESILSAGKMLISDVLIVGNGKQEAGALIFRSSDSRITDEEFEESVWDVVKQINERGQAHTKISRTMFTVISAEGHGLEKSSKGTILRKKAELRYEKQIETLYDGNQVQDKPANLSNDELRLVVQKTVREILGDGKIIGDDEDFYQQGVDSSQSTRIRNSLQKKLQLENLPWNVVYDCGTINRLSQYLIDERTGGVHDHENEEQLKEMRDLVTKFSNFASITPSSSPVDISISQTNRVVVLTGATGSLGAHILGILRDIPEVTQIICLVRAQTHKEARLRVSNSLLARRKPPLEISNEKISCLPSQLSKKDLGIDSETFEYIRKCGTLLIHAAWAVNFSIPLKSFVEDNLTSLHNLLSLFICCSNPAQFLFCSSTASVLGPNHPSIIYESISKNAADADTLGYSRSKWVAESICAAAAEQLAGQESRVKVLRIGQLTGDTQHGIWNMSEAWPLMLSTVDVLGCLPRLDEHLAWLPVDIAAKAVVEISYDNSKSEEEECLIYHLVNNNRATTWANLLGWLEENSPNKFEIIELKEWLAKLDDLESHPAKNLGWLWKGRRELSEAGMEAQKGNERSTKILDVTKVNKVSEAMRGVGPVEKDLAGKIWEWLRSEVRSWKGKG